MTASQLRELVEFARRDSPYYRNLYAQVRTDGNLRLEDLPVIDHSGFWAANTTENNQVLTGRQLEGVVFRTGGTTSRPKLTVFTRAELHAMARLWADGCTAAGLRPGDRVANLFYAGELYASFLFNTLALQESSVPAVHLPIAGSPAPEVVAETMAEPRATVVLATPTTLARVAAHFVARGESLASVRLFLFSGEAFHADQRPLLTKAFPRADIRSLGYASVDAGVLAAPVGGEPDTRVHRVHRPHKLVEIVDEHTGEPIREPGRPGLVLATDLVRRLMPVIRYPVGDVAEWVDQEDGRFRLLGRSETGARLGPMTVYLEDLRAVVDEVSGGRPISGMQAVQRRRDAKDELVLRIAGEIEDPERFAALVVARFDELRPAFGEHVGAGMIHPLTVEHVPLAKLAVNPRSGKLVRLLDQRSG
ncbi:phenylacetate--CoA ligase family protein [Streptomyces sp. H51]|uniref:phenylacetate--CoA ligase family protein n=1 Tax=Streptomyces sp. H51 TaxID=3111770 RepID=UPI002D794BDA|nr:AMP-binding protein [Streptomyces sp. H51]